MRDDGLEPEGRLREGLMITITIIMTCVVTTLIVVGFYYLEDKQDVREAEIFFNGTMLGQSQIIQEIQTTEILPYFNSTGHLNQITFEGLCEELELRDG